MKKKIIIATAVLVIVVLVVVALVISNANSLVQKFKPDLERIAAQTLGNPVKLGQLNVSLFPSAKINVSEVVIGSAERQGAFTLQNLQLAIGLLPLLSKTLDIVELKIDKPTIELIKDKSGVSIVGLTKAASAPGISHETQAPKQEKEPTGKDSALAINLKKLAVTNATLKFRDAEAQKEYTLSDLDVTASLALAGQSAQIPDLSISSKLNGQIPVGINGSNISVTLDSGEINAKELSLNILGSKIDAKVALNHKTQVGSVQIGSSGINLSKLPELASLVPALKDLAISGSLKPQLAVDLSGSTFKGSGKIDVAAVGVKADTAQVSDVSGSLPVRFDNTNQNISSDDLALSFNGVPLKLQFKAAKAGDAIKLESLSIKGFDGSIDGDADYNSKLFNFASNLGISKLSIEKALAALTPRKPAILTGNLEKVSLKVNGNSQNPKETVAGPASVHIVDGTLKNINVAADVLKKADNIPFLSGALYGVVPEQYRKDLESPDTPIKSLSAECQLGGGGMDCSSVSVESTLFSLGASGRLNFDSSLRLKASIAFAQPLSAGIAAKVKELNNILDAQGRLVIPLEISGSASSIKIVPDIKKLTELGAKNVVKKEAEKLLDRALGGKSKGGGLGGLFKF